MIDRALGVAGLAGTLLGIGLPIMCPNLSKRWAWGFGIGGVLLLGVSGGLLLLPVDAQVPPPTNGNCNFPGGTNNGTINCPSTNQSANPPAKAPPTWTFNNSHMEAGCDIFNIGPNTPIPSAEFNGGETKAGRDILHQQSASVTEAPCVPHFPPGAPPNPLDLFMTDFQPRNGLIWESFADIEVPENGLKKPFRIFYNVVIDTQTNVKFIAFYIPYVDGSIRGIVADIAKGHKKYMVTAEQNHWGVVKTDGAPDNMSGSNIKFNGAVYIYYQSGLSSQNILDFGRQFSQLGATVSFRSFDYMMAVHRSIQAGDIKHPPRFIIRDGVPARAE